MKNDKRDRLLLDVFIAGESTDAPLAARAAHLARRRITQRRCATVLVCAVALMVLSLPLARRRIETARKVELARAELHTAPPSNDPAKCEVISPDEAEKLLTGRSVLITTASNGQKRIVLLDQLNPRR